ncbi:hypothetical protein Pint_14557 [Pistacia integerrima]|uniref:Uncharacterized protein n=1 Tax=Pistacia integerrima TaxID=434235 RepID=A0ACC0Y609_9ROSI|nr:hypothetical protein Pint_14557 [Pistacia integerrima]
MVNRLKGIEFEDWIGYGRCSTALWVRFFYFLLYVGIPHCEGAANTKSPWNATGSGSVLISVEGYLQVEQESRGPNQIIVDVVGMDQESRDFGGYDDGGMKMTCQRMTNLREVFRKSGTQGLSLVRILREISSLRYACRKALADSQPRIRGQFAKTEEPGMSRRQ